MTPTAKKALVSSLFLNLVFLGLGRGSFGHFLLVGLAVLLGLVVATVGLAMAYLLASPGAREVGRSGIASGAILISVVASLPVGWFLNQRAVDRAQRYCEALAPALELYRQENGRYPEDLAELGAGGRLPWLLRTYAFYAAVDHGTSYRFTIPDPSSLLAGYDFKSQSGTWYYWD